MALHDRLRPTEIAPVAARPSHGMLLIVTLIVLAAGFAYAMPRAMQVSAEEPLAEEVAVVETTPTPSESPTAEVVVTDEDDTETEEDSGDKAGNHGSAVSTAAHCDLKGRAHGELVRSIAKDKDATVADAEAACTAAQAAALTAPARTTGKPAVTGNTKMKAPRADKGPSSKSPHAATDDTDSADGTSDASADTDAATSDDGSADAPKAPPGQANKTKP